MRSYLPALPKWVVKYLVHNTLGRLWLSTYPGSPLKAQLRYYVEPAEQTPEVREQLKALTPPPSLIIQLPAGWAIEDVVRWMLDPSGAAELAALSAALPGFAFASLDALRDLLKTSNNKKENTVGLKEDVLAHEAVAGVLELTPACRAR